MRVTKPAIWSISILVLLLFSNSPNVGAQSLDINSPSPVSTTELVGRIVARDVGDARFTDHYYSFAANKGDLLITIVSANLNGDVDVFTAGTLRPLMKFTVYSESSSPVTKAVFLRKREDLILRVQARSPNDDEGTYQITFGGTFEPLPQTFATQIDTPTDESITLSARSSSQKGRRVSSVGARIEEPAPPPAEVAAAPTPDPTPEPTPETPVETVQPTVTEPTAEAEAPKPEPPRNSRSRRGSSRRSNARAKTEPAKPTEPSASTEEKPAESTETVTTPPRRRGSSRRTEPTETPVPTTPEPDAGPRLIIETADGTLVDRSMNTVRRVMVEKGQVVVVSNDGRVQRIALSQVTRMSIAP
jgi:hypothetical protein